MLGLTRGLVLLLLGICGGEKVTSPRFEPRIANEADNFEFQATGVQNVTQNLE